MKAKDEFSVSEQGLHEHVWTAVGLAGSRCGHHCPGHNSVEAEGDCSSQKLPKHHLVGSRERKHKGVQDAFSHVLVPKVSLLEVLGPTLVPSLGFYPSATQNH